MDPQFQTSFIPKQDSQQKNIIAERSVSIVLLVSIIIFVATLALAGGVFLYERFLTSQISQKDQSLTRAQSAFEPSLIQTLRRLSLRIDAANQILATHQAPSVLFDELSQLTLKTVSFKSLDYSSDDKGQLKLAMRGVARDYASVALQSDIFGKSKVIKSPIFSDLNPDQNGVINFTLTATVDPSALIYHPELATQTGPSTASTTTAVPPAAGVVPPVQP